MIRRRRSPIFSDCNFRPDVAGRALAWLDQRVDAYKRLTGCCNRKEPILRSSVFPRPHRAAIVS